MNLVEYQQLALRTAAPHPDKNTALTTWALGLCGESGKVADLVKKHVGHGHPLDKQKLLKELGDVAWYVVVMANEIDFEVERVEAAALFLGEWKSEQRLNDLAFNSLSLVRCASTIGTWITSGERGKRFVAAVAVDLADLLRRISVIATAIDSSLDEVLALNVAKPEERYPDGFSVEKSLNRVETI